jgi:hypothetical protein
LVPGVEVNTCRSNPTYSSNALFANLFQAQKEIEMSCNVVGSEIHHFDLINTNYTSFNPIQECKDDVSIGPEYLNVEAGSNHSKKSICCPMCPIIRFCQEELDCMYYEPLGLCMNESSCLFMNITNDVDFEKEFEMLYAATNAITLKSKTSEEDLILSTIMVA